jgi:putative nucleotidyltransferase with HDIG domain
MVSIKELKDLAKDYTLLYVEDDVLLNNETTAYLKKFFKRVDNAFDGKDGLDLYKKNSDYDLVVTDIKMSNLDGIGMSKEIKNINPSQSIVIISAYTDASYFIDSIMLGVDGYIIKPMDYNQFNEVIYKRLKVIKNQKEIDIYNSHLLEIIDKKSRELEFLYSDKVNNYKDTLLALVNIIESRDTYTAGHSQRVADYSVLIAKELKLDESDIKKIYEASILHDIGKIVIPDAVLLKPTGLNDIEYELIKEHVSIGANLLEQIPMFKELSSIIIAHHERCDGSGYPKRLKAKNIPFLSKIMAVADSFDAMTTNRIYKPRMSIQDALDELDELKYSFYDTSVVDAAQKVLKDVVISNNINQLPHTKIEEARFSYFYRDQMCNCFNKEYLELKLMQNRQHKQYKTLIVIFLGNFHQYNKATSWEAGNQLLKSVSSELQKHYQDGLVFRIQGDDFVVMSESILDKNIKLKSLDRTDVEYRVEEFDLLSINSYTDLDKAVLNI